MKERFNKMDSKPIASVQKPIRIGILGTQGIPAQYGGFETFAEELATRWAMDEDFVVSVVCPGPRLAHLPTSLGRVQLDYVTSPKCGPLTNVLFDVWSLWVHRQSFDVVYMLGYGAAFACFIPRIWNTKVWINMDGLEWKRSKWSKITRGYLKLMEWVATKTANRLIADAAAIKSYLLDMHTPKIEINFIPYGANPININNHPSSLLPEGIESLGYHLVIARLEPENQIQEMVDGYLASNSRAPLLVVGGTENPNKYVQQLLSQSSPRLRFLGGIYDKSKLSALRCHALTYLHGHTVGGTNPSLLEALSAGRPIIAHANSFNREVLGTLGEYFENSQDVRKLFDNIHLITNPSIAYSDSCRTRVIESYNWQDIKLQYEDLARLDCNNK